MRGDAYGSEPGLSAPRQVDARMPAPVSNIPGGTTRSPKAYRGAACCPRRDWRLGVETLMEVVNSGLIGEAMRFLDIVIGFIAAFLLLMVLLVGLSAVGGVGPGELLLCTLPSVAFGVMVVRRRRRARGASTAV